MSQRSEAIEPIYSVISRGLASGRVADIDVMYLQSLDVTEGLRSLVLDYESEGDPTPRAGSPIIAITPPSEPLMVSQRSRQLSSQMTPPTPRPRLRRKAATAPPGALQLYSGIKPQPPRRAISARAARPLQTSASRYRRTSMMDPLLPRISQLGTPASRSPISRRKSYRKSVGKVGLKPKNNVWRTSPQPTKKFQLLSEALSDRTRSFSEKARVKETLKRKKMEILQTQFVDFKSKDLPGTPTSMGATPRELYGRSGSSRGLSPSVAFQLGNRSSLLSVSPRRAKHLSLPLTPNAQRRDTVKHGNAMPRVASSKKTVYIPGPIQLEERTIVTPRRGSIATMDPFDPGTEPKAIQFSDMVALDRVAMFFEGLGMIEEPTEACLDRFWVPEQRASRQVTTPQKAAPAVPPRPPIPSVPATSSGFFSPKKALQQEEGRHASLSTPGRQRGRLRQLLKSSRALL